MPAQEKATELHLDDYQPRGTDPLVRLVYNRAFPDGFTKPLMSAKYPRSLRIGEPEPPMRNAIDDLQVFLDGIREDLGNRALFPVEVSVAHDHLGHVEAGEAVGWHYRAQVLAVPFDVIEDQAERFAAWQREQQPNASK